MRQQISGEQAMHRASASTTTSAVEVPFPREPLQAAFERQALRRPRAVALEADGATLSFEELDRRASDLAHELRRRRAGPGTVVGVCLERDANLVVALLAVLKTGAAYLPLDPLYPPERLRHMLETAQASLAVVDDHLAHLLGPARGCALLGPRVEGRERPPAAREGPSAPVRPRDPCYVMFTSGSTGEPKGVLMSHEAVVNTLVWVNDRCAVGPGDRALFVTSPSFDLSVYDIFGVLGAGATLVMASAASLEEPADLARAMVRRRITLWSSTPAALERVLPFVNGAESSPLRWVLLSGDWIPLTLPGALRALFPRARLLALGGATEAAIWSNAFEVGEVEPSWKSIPYGRPIANMRYHVLDEQRRPVLAGDSGELYIGGVGLAEGYIHRPALTAERFVPDPFVPGERLYRTGDRARYLPDGNIELLGRMDRQVKLRGYRLELAEVEAALLGCSSVRQAVCAVYPDAQGLPVLVAHVVPRAGATLEPALVRQQLAERLPSFMLPDEVLACEELPLSPQGKIDRQALAEARRATTARHGDHHNGDDNGDDNGGRHDDDNDRRDGGSLRQAQEAAVLAVWRELLGREHIGRHDSFASLGGHSLLAVKLVVALRHRFGKEVTLSTLLAHPTVASLASHLFGETEGTSAPPASLRRAPHLFALQEGGSRPPLVLVAGVGGYAFTYRNFPRFLTAEQPVYALQSIGAEPGEPLTAMGIEEIAAVYERELAVLPEGPLVLGGFSFGILPAFALALRLQRKGRGVPLLVSLDGFAPGFPRRHPWKRRLADHLARLGEASAAERRAYLAARWKKVEARLYALAGRAADLAPVMPFDEDLSRRLQELWVLQQRAAAAYRPLARAESRLLLVRAEEPESWPGTDMSDPLYGWERHVRGPVSLATIPAGHTDLLASAAHQKACAAIIGRHIDGL